MSDNRELVDQIWQQYDKNGDGHLDAKEAKKFFDDVCGKGSGLEDKRAELEALVDKNGDGRLNKDEMMEALNLG